MLAHVYKRILPKDLEDLVAQSKKKSRSICFQVPLLRVVWMLLKYAPWRAAFARSVIKYEWSTGRKGPISDQQLHDLREALANTFLTVRTDKMKDFTMHVGKGVHNHHGPLPLLQSLGIIRKASAGRLVGQGLQAYIVKESKITLARLKRIRNLATKLDAMEAPRTIPEWIAQVKKMKDVAYNKMWIARCQLIWKMRASGISRLALTSDVTMKMFSAGFPDQRNWCSKFGSLGPGGKGLSVQEVFARLQYEEEPELFTMRACLFGSKYIQRIPLNTLRSHVGKVKVHLSQFRKASSMWCHPEVTLRSVMS
jgi:hypothetical protein